MFDLYQYYSFDWSLVIIGSLYSNSSFSWIKDDGCSLRIYGVYTFDMFDTTAFYSRHYTELQF